jgi:hypothetical protein
MIGEPDAGKPHVRFDEGVQETYDTVTRLHPTLPRYTSPLRNHAGAPGRGQARGIPRPYATMRTRGKRVLYHPRRTLRFEDRNDKD